MLKYLTVLPMEINYLLRKMTRYAGHVRICLIGSFNTCGYVMIGTLTCADMSKLCFDRYFNVCGYAMIGILTCADMSNIFPKVQFGNFLCNIPI